MLYMAYNKISKNETIKKGVEEKMLYLIITILALCIFVMFVKIDSMTFDLMEKQGLINASRKNLERAEKKIDERNKIINSLKNENTEYEEQLNVIKQIINSKNFTFDKVEDIKKELVDNLQTEN